MQKQKKRKDMRAQMKRTYMQAETTVTIHSCISLNEQEYPNMI